MCLSCQLIWCLDVVLTPAPLHLSSCHWSSQSLILTFFIRWPYPLQKDPIRDVARDIALEIQFKSIFGSFVSNIYMYMYIPWCNVNHASLVIAHVYNVNKLGPIHKNLVFVAKYLIISILIRSTCPIAKHLKPFKITTLFHSHHVFALSFLLNCSST